ncbi:IDEAL domain-containing protein [Priestia megaterium]|uniref:IDEAL domain-containing protein n=1 Tax=Priestia megaterium TaxID=1404 RepID=UPI00366F7995
MRRYIRRYSRQQAKEKVFDSVLAQLVLDKALRDFEKTQILMKIDESLQNRDREEFIRLTEKLRSVS